MNGRLGGSRADMGVWTGEDDDVDWRRGAGGVGGGLVGWEGDWRVGGGLDGYHLFRRVTSHTSVKISSCSSTAILTSAAPVTSATPHAYRHIRLIRNSNGIDFLKFIQEAAQIRSKRLCDHSRRHQKRHRKQVRLYERC